MKLIIFALFFMSSLFATEQNSVNIVMERKSSYSKRDVLGRTSFETPSPKLDRNIKEASKRGKEREKEFLRQIAQRQAARAKMNKNPSSVKQLFCCCSSQKNPN